MKVFFFDLGNTRCKWTEGDRSGSFSYQEMEGALSVLLGACIPGTEIVFASVVTDNRRARFVNAALIWSVQPLQECVVRPQVFDVVCGYSDVTRLGVDRWLAVLAGWKMAPEGAVVVDLGTAATIDFVGRGGNHLGGFILPGLKLAISSLLSGTNNVIVSETDIGSASRHPGVSTSQAVGNGALAAIAATIEVSLVRHQENHPKSKLLITGGDAALVAQHLGCHYRHCSCLVFDGMRLLHEHKLTVEVSN